MPPAQVVWRSRTKPALRQPQDRCGMGMNRGQRVPQRFVIELAACYNTQKRPGGVAYHAEEIRDHGAGAGKICGASAAGGAGGFHH